MISKLDLLWTAGFLEGDGSFQVHPHNDNSPFITAGQRHKWPLNKLIDLYGGSITKTKTPKGKRFFQWVLWSHNAVDLMEHLYKYMSPKSKARIRKAFVAWKSVKRREKARIAKPIRWREV